MGRPGPASVVRATSVAQLNAGDTTGLERDERGKITTPRSEIGRQHALSILENPDYRKALEARMIAGTAGPVEVWIWRIGYGDPPRQREDDGGDAERFKRLQEAVRELLRDNPEASRAIAKRVAQGVLDVKALPLPVEVAPETTTEPDGDQG